MHFNNQWLLDDFEHDEFAPPVASTPGPLQRNVGIVWRGTREVMQVTAIAFVMYLGLNVAIPRYEVEGHSMEPNFHSAERVVVSTVHYQLLDPQRGDVVVFERGKNLIKRVIGLPGETVRLREGQVFINGQLLQEAYIDRYCTLGTCRDTEWELGPEEYFVLGDNRVNSHDSHNFGPIHRDQIIGRVVLRYWPVQNLRAFLDGVY
jgi:signal peptidase I